MPGSGKFLAVNNVPTDCPDPFRGSPNKSVGLVSCRGRLSYGRTDIDSPRFDQLRTSRGTFRASHCARNGAVEEQPVQPEIVGARFERLADNLVPLAVIFRERT